MSYFEDKCRAEADLSWFFNECQATMGIGAQCYDPEANLGGGKGWDEIGEFDQVVGDPSGRNRARLIGE